jgi:hypothetical protein
MQRPIQWKPEAVAPIAKLPGRETANTSLIRVKVKNGGVYLHSHIRLHGVLLDSLSTGIISPLTGLWTIVTLFVLPLLCSHELKGD